MKKITFLLSLILGFLLLTNSQNLLSTDAEIPLSLQPFKNQNIQNLNSSNEKISYSIGMIIANSLKAQGVNEVNADVFKEALESVMTGQPTMISMQEADGIFRQYMTEIQAEKQKEFVAEGEKFLADNAKRAEVTTTASGLQYEVLKSGDGATPTATQTVEVHYHGTLLNGTVFDSSVQRGKSISFPVNGVIPGWVEALQLMSVGDKWKLFIPQDLAYGAQGAGQSIPPFSTLIFEVELLGVK